MSRRTEAVRTEVIRIINAHYPEAIDYLFIFDELSEAIGDFIYSLDNIEETMEDDIESYEFNKKFDDLDDDSPTSLSEINE